MNWSKQTILITGGTGSFGRKCTEILLHKYKPRRIIILSRDELKQHEMRKAFPDPTVNFFLGDIRDKDRLYRAFKADVDLVIHAAALKQVPACEYNPFEAIKTNILGAANIIDAAIDCQVPKVIALSTDKAVNPVNLYGATKLCAEKLFVNGNSYAGGKISRFSCVRYGNVLASRGSVIPTFLSQRQSGEITITDLRMTRFWITLEQAVEFVICCVDLMAGGEVFIPRIPSMGLKELAKAIAPGCEIKVTGIRMGEKLHESLLSPDEARSAVAMEKMFVVLPEKPSWGETYRVTGQPLPDGFSYTSDTNDRWLSKEELSQLMDNSAFPVR